MDAVLRDDPSLIGDTVVVKRLMARLISVYGLLALALASWDCTEL